MLELLTVVLFILIAAGTAWTALRGPKYRTQGVLRLAPLSAHATGEMPSLALLWRELVSRIGAAIPASARDMPALKRRLVRAGYRNLNGARYFQGIRLVTIPLFGGAAAIWCWRTHVQSTNFPLIVVASGVLGYMLPMQVLLSCIRRRQHALSRGLPNALDLMVVCVESGLGIDQTVLQVAKELESAHQEIASEFTMMNLELRAGKRRAEALHNLADRTGVEDIKKLVAVLVQTDRFGTSIAQSLRGHADYLRAMTRQKAEEQASKLAVKLVFPIFFCVLPTLFLVTIGPVITRLVRDLIPMIENL